jgi:hypothetical protein
MEGVNKMTAVKDKKYTTKDRIYTARMRITDPKLAAELLKHEGISLYDPPRAIIIRNVPESVRRELKARAAKEGKSMQAVIVGLIEKYVKGGHSDR